MSEPGEYILFKPVGETETGRLDLQHRTWLTQHNALYSAPLSESPTQRVLDIGCGPGTWAIAFATEHPDSPTSLGLDINPKVRTTKLQFRRSDDSAWASE